MSDEDFQPAAKGGYRGILWVGVAWFALALAVGATQLLARIPVPAPQVVLAGLTVALLAAYAKSTTVHSWVQRLPLRALVLFHVTRLVGFYFLYLCSRGELPAAFAVPGGCGDIAVTVSALVLAGISSDTRAGHRVYLAWNIFGLMDILFVVVNAARLGLADPHSMAVLTRLPLSLLPTFLVPLIIAGHIVVFARLRAAPDAAVTPISR